MRLHRITSTFSVTLSNYIQSERAKLLSIKKISGDGKVDRCRKT